MKIKNFMFEIHGTERHHAAFILDLKMKLYLTVLQTFANSPISYFLRIRLHLDFVNPFTSSIFAASLTSCIFATSLTSCIFANSLTSFSLLYVAPNLILYVVYIHVCTTHIFELMSTFIFATLEFCCRSSPPNIPLRLHFFCEFVNSLSYCEKLGGKQDLLLPFYMTLI